MVTCPHTNLKRFILLITPPNSIVIAVFKKLELKRFKNVEIEGAVDVSVVDQCLARLS